MTDATDLTDQISPTFCVLPWVQVHVDEAGRVLPCCGVEHTAFKPPKGGDSPNVNRQALPEAWNDDAFRTLRTELLNGNKPRACNICFYQESHGATSMRLNKNQAFLGTPRQRKRLIPVVSASSDNGGKVAELPLSYDLRPGKLCNLKCRMCSAKWSNLIEQDPVHHQWAPAPAPPRFADGRVAAEWYENVDLVEERLLVDPARIEHLHFGGGEPFIMPAVQHILQRLAEDGRATDIRLSFVTNLKKIAPKLLDHVAQFRAPAITVSVDGFGEVYEYIRFPGRWSKLERNLEQLRQVPGVKLICRPTIQAYNVLSITQLLDWLESKQIDWQIGLVVAPAHLSARLLSERGKQLACERLEAFLSRSVQAAASPELLSRTRMVMADMMKPLPQRDHRRLLDEFMAFTNDLDATRGQSIHDSLPEVADAIAEAAGGWDHKPKFAVAEAAPQAPGKGRQGTGRRKTLAERLPHASNQGS